jgi:hypothetical protein
MLSHTRKHARSLVREYVARLLGASLTAAAFVTALMLSAGEVHACSDKAKVGASTGATYAMTHVVASNANLVMESSKPAHCSANSCGGGAHPECCHQLGCCAACTAVIGAANPSLDLFEGPNRLTLLNEGNLVAQIPKCQFRPPRISN